MASSPATVTAPAHDAPGYDAHGHDDHGHGAAHPPHLKHYFVSSEQQFEAAKLGMWLFLVTEILLFGGMFVAYAIFRAWYPELFLEASEQLDTVMGATNTLVLLLSSFTVAYAIRGAQTDNQKVLFWNLVATVVLAGVFMVVKYFEYTHKFHLGIFPGAGFDPVPTYLNPTEGIGADPRAGVFFSIYYVMTGIHGFHVLIGMIAISILAWKARQGKYTSQWYTPVENVGLYWHVVDIIWIFLFPLMYLI
ncbi:MAG: cytochrome c oxidase subunit 3 family protein [Bacteroidota bacterium]